MAVADFEVASIAEWAQYCSHRDFREVFELSAGSRFDVRCQKTVPIAGNRQAGVAESEKFKVTVPGLVAGAAAFVEITESDGQQATAVPLVFLQEEPQAPSFVRSALYPGEKLVFVAQHQDRTSILSTQRAASFEQGAVSGSVTVSDALISRHDGALVIHGSDAKGFATAVSFKGLYSPLSVERLLCGLKAAALSASAGATEKPEEFAAHYFGASIESTVYNAVVQSPGITLSGVSRETGLNRYLCRSVLRGLCLEGRVVPDKEGFWPAGSRAQPQAAGDASVVFENVASEQEKPAASEEAVAAIRSFEDLAQLCYRLLAKQKDLERQVDELHAEVKVLSGSGADISELKLQMSRLEAELSAALRKLDDTDSEYQTNVKALAENAKWAADKEAHLSWADGVVSDKVQKKVSEYKAYISDKAKKARPAAARAKNAGVRVAMSLKKKK
ncbi:MAG: hypothetical protein WCX64_02840 [Candidatus Micrarchaeia archaeon]